MNNFKQDKRGGLYWVDNKPYVSVTSALTVINNFGLNYWAKQQVYQAVILNPSISETEAMAAPFAVSDKAKNRGTTIHSIIEAWKNTGEIPDTTPDFQPYIDAFKKCLAEHPLTILEQERTVISHKEKFAGTLDILARIGDNLLPSVIDIKTSKKGGVYDSHELQVSAYIEALREQGVETDGGVVIVLRENGTYVFQRINNCYPVFLSALSIYKWQKREELAKYEN